MEIDHATGSADHPGYVSVHDCGNMLDPTDREGAAPRRAGARHRRATDGGAEATTRTGQPQNASFRTYFLPTVHGDPRLHAGPCRSRPTPFTPGGYKGAARPARIGPPPCLANALEDALRPLGPRFGPCPLSPDFVWRTVQAARAQSNGKGLRREPLHRREGALAHARRPTFPGKDDDGIAGRRDDDCGKLSAAGLAGGAGRQRACLSIRGRGLGEAQDDATVVSLREQEAAGLDLLTDGEQRRLQFIFHVLSRLGGFDVANRGLKAIGVGNGIGWCRG